MIEARLNIPTRDRNAAKAIIKSMAPDNAGMKGLAVRTRAFEHSASITISYDGGIETFISTLDDLLRCIQAASATLGKITQDKGF